MIWSKNTIKEVKKAMDRRDRVEEAWSVEFRLFPLPSFLLLAPQLSFSLLLCSPMSLEWNPRKMERSLAINSLCHNLKSVRRHLCTARTKVVRPGRTRRDELKSAKSGKTRTKPGKGRTRSSQIAVSSCVLLQTCRKQTNTQQYQILKIYRWNAHDSGELGHESGTKTCQI